MVWGALVPPTTRLMHATSRRTAMRGASHMGGRAALRQAGRYKPMQAHRAPKMINGKLKYTKDAKGKPLSKPVDAQVADARAGLNKMGATNQAKLRQSARKTATHKKAIQSSNEIRDQWRKMARNKDISNRKFMQSIRQGSASNGKSDMLAMYRHLGGDPRKIAGKNIKEIASALNRQRTAHIKSVKGVVDVAKKERAGAAAKGSSAAKAKALQKTLDSAAKPSKKAPPKKATSKKATVDTGKLGASLAAIGRDGAGSVAKFNARVDQIAAMRGVTKARLAEIYKKSFKTYTTLSTSQTKKQMIAKFKAQHRRDVNYKAA